MLNRFLHSLRSVEMTKRAVGMTVLLLLLAGQGSAWATEKTVTYNITGMSTSMNQCQLTFTRSGSGFGTSTGSKVATINNVMSTSGFSVQLDDGVSLDLSLNKVSSLSFVHNNTSDCYGILLNLNGNQGVRFTVSCTDYYMTHVKLAELNGDALRGSEGFLIQSSALDVDVIRDKASYNENNSNYQARVTANTNFGQLTITLSDTPDFSLFQANSDGSYQIAHPYDLYHLADYVNNGSNDCSGLTFRQTQNITFDGAENNYTPIGYHRSDNDKVGFCGTFDGGGFSVSGINVNTASDYMGLFGYVDYNNSTNYGTVRNVVLANSTFTGRQIVGGIAGYNRGGIVQNCRLESSVTINAKSQNANQHGGIVGRMEGSASINGCYSGATVSRNGKSDCQQYGGIVGSVGQGGTVKNCLYTGTTISAYEYIGAIAGFVNENSTLANNYYTTIDLGGVNSSDQDGARRARTVTMGVNAALAGDETAYNLSGLTAIGTGNYALRYNDGSTTTLYSGATQTLTFNYTGTAVSTLGYAVVFSANGTPFGGSSLVVPAGDVSITASATDLWGISSDADGSAAHPYRIGTRAALDLLAKYVNGTDGNAANEFNGKYFLQTADITYDGTENNYTPIGKSNRYFRGHYNGGGYTVSGININSTGNNIGLFGYVYFPGTVENITLANSTIKGFTDVGSIVGYLYGDQFDPGVSNCRVESDVTIGAGSGSASNHGGIVGTLRCGTISGCISAATITHNDLNNCQIFGGIVGYIEGDVTTVQDCLYTGSTVTAGSKTGAIVGSINNSSTLTNNYYTGDEVPGGVNGSDSDGARRAHTVTLGENVVLVGSETAYNLSGLTAIGTTALRYNDGSTTTLYSGAEQALTLNCTETVPDGYTVVYTFNGVTMYDDTFMMPSDDVTVSAMVVEPKQTNTIALNAGWNWVSFNVTAVMTDLKDALTSYNNGRSISINSKTNNTFFRNSRWHGSLNNLDLTQMYQIQIGEPREIYVDGYPIDPGSSPVTVNSGENWIGFPLNESMTVADAFAEFAVCGDIIISQSAFAFYTGSRWRGTLTTLEPGQGYMYHSATEVGRVFVFPEPNSQVSNSSVSAQYESHWPEFYHPDYRFNSPVVAAIRIGNDFIESNDNWEDWEVAAFVGDECRGHAFMRYDSEEFGDQNPVVELPVYYNNAGETVTFKLYDHATGIEYSRCSPSIALLTDQTHVEFYTGSEDPVILSFIDDSQVTLSGYPHDGLYWATFYCGYAWYTLPEGAQAYTMDADFHLYRLGTDGRTIPEDLAVVIISDKQSITLTRDNGTSEIDVNRDENILQGSDSPVTVSSISGTPHVLGVAGDVFGFHPYGGASIPANKAYYLTTQ